MMAFPGPKTAASLSAPVGAQSVIRSGLADRGTRLPSRIFFKKYFLSVSLLFFLPSFVYGLKKRSVPVLSSP